MKDFKDKKNKNYNFSNWSKEKKKYEKMKKAVRNKNKGFIEKYLDKFIKTGKAF